MDELEKDFPFKESYRNAEGKNIEFNITFEELPIGYSVMADETKKSKGKRIGYSFRCFSSISPYQALGKIRDKIRKNLSTKYIDDSAFDIALTHDELVGRITSSDAEYQIVIETDGKEIDQDRFWKILSAYEGFEIELVIKEQ